MNWEHIFEFIYYNTTFYKCFSCLNWLCVWQLKLSLEYRKIRLILKCSKNHLFKLKISIKVSKNAPFGTSWKRVWLQHVGPMNTLNQMTSELCKVTQNRLWRNRKWTIPCFHNTMHSSQRGHQKMNQISLQYVRYAFQVAIVGIIS